MLETPATKSVGDRHFGGRHLGRTHWEIGFQMCSGFFTENAVETRRVPSELYSKGSPPVADLKLEY